MLVLAVMVAVKVRGSGNRITVLRHRNAVFTNRNENGSDNVSSIAVHDAMWRHSNADSAQRTDTVAVTKAATVSPCGDIAMQ